MDFVVKPFIAAEVLLRVHNLLMVRIQQMELERRNRELQEEVVHRTRELEEYELELKEAQMEVVARLARAAEQRDDDTAHHTQRVALTCSLLAQGLGLPEADISLIRLAAPLHDVGKIGIPDAVLLKPGQLDDGEVQEMRRHCNIGAGLLSGGHSSLVSMAERIALTHHERWDGTGYPREIGGMDIPIEGRVVAVADVFDALTHSRPYKAAWSIEGAVEEIGREAGRHFDPQVVEVFMELPHEELV
jgi:putative two-component system response regulator